MLELQDRSLRQQRVQVVRIQVDRGKRHACVDPAVNLQEFDLQIDRRPEVGLFLLQPAKFENLARFGALWGGRAIGHTEILMSNG